MNESNGNEIIDGHQLKIDCCRLYSKFMRFLESEDVKDKYNLAVHYLVFTNHVEFLHRAVDKVEEELKNEKEKENEN